MKKLLLSLGIVFLSAGAVMAQGHTHSHDDGHNHGAAAAAPSGNLTLDHMKFVADVHDFGNLVEGPSAEYEFEFTNTGKEPIVISRVNASCGCTTPDWTREPVLPGKKGKIKAAYATAGRPGQFEKNLTVFTNAGNKLLIIKGNVDKAPTSSAPQNNSMIRTN